MSPVLHVTRDSDTTFKVKRSVAGAYCGSLTPSLFVCKLKRMTELIGILAVYLVQKAKEKCAPHEIL